jgi:hypothetical protein
MVKQKRYAAVDNLLTLFYVEAPNPHPDSSFLVGLYGAVYYKLELRAIARVNPI